MKSLFLLVFGLLPVFQASAQTAEALDLRVPEQPAAEAAAPESRDPPGTYYGDTSGLPARGDRTGPLEADDGQAKVSGSFTTGIGHTKGYGTSHYNALDLNVRKSFGDGDKPNTMNLQIRVEKSDGPAFGPRGPYPYFDQEAGGFPR